MPTKEGLTGNSGFAYPSGIYRYCWGIHHTPQERTASFTTLQAWIRQPIKVVPLFGAGLFLLSCASLSRKRLQDAGLSIDQDSEEWETGRRVFHFVAGTWELHRKPTTSKNPSRTHQIGLTPLSGSHLGNGVPLKHYVYLWPTGSCLPLL